MTGRLPEDLEAIVRAARDLAYYRTVPTAGDLSRAVAWELLDRARALPDLARDDA